MCFSLLRYRFQRHVGLISRKKPAWTISVIGEKVGWFHWQNKAYKEVPGLGFSSVVEHVLAMCEMLGSLPAPQKRKEKENPNRESILNISCH
jgi:hypothetical protein